MDTSFLPFTPNFSATHSAIIESPLASVFEKLGTPLAHEDVCRLSTLCTAIDIGETDVVELDQGKALKESSFLRKDAAVESESSTSVAKRLHFLLEETIPVLLGIIKTKVQVRGTFTWVDPPEEAFSSGGPVYSLYESEVVGGLGITIWRLRTMEEVDSGAGDGKKVTKVTENLHGVGPSYLRWLIAKEAITKHKAHVERLPELF
ncbi:hypothetical protein H1R20_g15585, partial [Candolleomyces eurysporus]